MTIFQNISKLRDIYGEMNKFNHNFCEVMNKLEKQNSKSLAGEGTINQQQMLFGGLFLGSNTYSSSPLSSPVPLHFPERVGWNPLQQVKKN